MTTLAERKNRGDLIEAYKAVNGNSIIGNLFNIGRSGINLVSDIRVSKGSSKVQEFFNEKSYIFGISFIVMLNYHVLFLVLK